VTLTVGELLNDQKVYTVPPFQRDFSWREKQEVRDFWYDLMDLCSDPEGHTGYFMGSMVVIPAREGNSVVLLDGQQRLATFLLLLGALRDALRSSTMQEAGNWVEEISRTLRSRDMETLRVSPKLMLNREDTSFFNQVVIEGGLPEPARKSHKLIRAASSFLRKEVEQRLLKGGEAFVRGLLRALTKRLVLIRIEVDSEENAHVLFEALNDRGLDLSVTDLVKNYVFSIAGEHFQLIETMWREVVDQVGDHRATKFLRHFGISRYELARKQQLYAKLKARVKARDVKRFMKELSGDALVYANLSSPGREFWGDTQPNRLLEDLQVLGVEQAYVLLMAGYGAFYKDRRRDFEELLRSVVNLSFRYNTVCRLNPNEQEGVYSRLSIRLRTGSMSLHEVLAKLRALSPASESFVTSFAAMEVRASALAKYILLRINNHLLEQRGERELKTDTNVTLEHVIPKRPDKNWTAFLAQRNAEPRDLVPRLGNMTILDKGYNRKLSNRFYDVKRDMYAKSALPLNRALALYDEFGPAELDTRQRQMAQTADEIWRV